MDLTECVDDARRVADYLQSTLLVPRSQIVTLTNTEATKERIVEELKALAHRGSVADDAPIVIYFATHSFVDTATKSTYLVPYPPSENIAGGGLDLDDLKSCALSYNAIVDILKHIAEEKTDNIVRPFPTAWAPLPNAKKTDWYLYHRLSSSILVMLVPWARMRSSSIRLAKHLVCGLAQVKAHEGSPWSRKKREEVITKRHR
jgi:hypothetical protein